MEKDEIDFKVSELARSGGNPAMRGVMFANMYIKVKAYDSAMSWLDKFLTVKGKFLLANVYFTYGLTSGRDADAYSLYGDCQFGKENYQKALDCYKVRLTKFSRKCAEISFIHGVFHRPSRYFSTDLMQHF